MEIASCAFALLFGSRKAPAGSAKIGFKVGVKEFIEGFNSTTMCFLLCLIHFGIAKRDSAWVGKKVQSVDLQGTY